MMSQTKQSIQSLLAQKNKEQLIKKINSCQIVKWLKDKKEKVSDVKQVF